MVFLHKDDNFLPYTPRRKENLHENLHGLEKEALVESLELTIRKEVMNMYLLSTYRVFLHKTEPLNPPPPPHFPSSFLHSYTTLPSSMKTYSTSTTTLSTSKMSRRRSLSRVRRTSMWLKRSTRGPCSPCRPTGCLHCSFIGLSSSTLPAVKTEQRHVAACRRIRRAGYK